MAMSWDDEGILNFGVYSKPNCQTKYLNAESCHPHMTKVAISRGVAIRHATLTTRKADNESKSLSELYPDAHKALLAAGLIKEGGRLPKLGRLLANREAEKAASTAREEEMSKDRRSTFCIVRYSGEWRMPISKTLKRLKEKHQLGWLHVRICHRRHNNLQEMLLTDGQSKLMEHVQDLTSAQKYSCNCPSSHKVDGRCIYGDDTQCTLACTIYKVTCKWVTNPATVTIVANQHAR